VAAQPLSGTVTINSGQATGGTNFQTFTVFAATINSVGISGPLVVNVAPNSGPYVEQPAFTNITGASLTNSITINGNGNLLTFSSSNSAQPWTLLMNGAKYFYFNNLNVQGTGTYAYVCVLTNAADFNTFSSCTFSCPANTTSSSHVAFMTSASSTGLSTGANSANYTSVLNCQMFSGYYCMMWYGLTGTPYQQGNRIIGCSIQDYYVYGCYFYYQANGNVSYNTVERPTRTTLSTFYGIMIYYNPGGTLCEGNIIQKPCDAAPATSITAYCYYWYCPITQLFGPNIYRNNILRNIRMAGTIYGGYTYYASGNMYHNTFSYDDPNNATALTIYGVYTYYSSSYANIEFRNNIISITRAGSGTNYGLYVGATGGGLYISNNDIYVNAPSSTNYLGYHPSAGTCSFSPAGISSWTAGVDPLGAFVNPLYVNYNTDNHPTNLAMDNLGGAYGVVFDQQNAVRNAVTPDMGALEFNTPLCAATPTGVTLNGANYQLCPGQSASLSLSNLSAAAPSGITYAWQTSTVSGVGPWTAAPGNNTGMFYTTPATYGTTYYQMVMTCTNPGGGAATPVATLQVAGVTTNVVTYNEGFENIGIPNRLPNCSWAATSLGNLNTTYLAAASGNRLPNNGNGFAAFSNNSAGTTYYYTNGIQMNTGLTYSAGTWWATEYTGASNWTLSVMVGTAQTAASMTQVAIVAPAISGSYKLLGGTFTVPSSGLYYVAIKATSSSGAAQYLSIDDVFVNVPCQGSNNPAVNVVTSNTNICSGGVVNMSANGANSYAWSGPAGQISALSSVTVAPANTTTYNVIGTNTVTGCTSTVNQVINVKQSPVLAALASPPLVCAGNKVILSAQGAGVTSYTWSTGSNNAITTVSPNVQTSYIVAGTASNNCSSSASVVVQVNPLPNVTGYATPNSICVGETSSLTGNGAINYQVSSPNYFNQGNFTVQQPAIYIGNMNFIGVQQFLFVGTDANGCSGTFNVNLTVNACTGLNKYGIGSSNISIYPNPTSGEFNVELVNGLDKTIQVMDLTGRIVLEKTSTSDVIGIDIKGLASGIYYVKILSQNSTSVVKLVKE